MPDLAKFLHLAAAVLWLGGMAFMLLALRPSLGILSPPERLRLLDATLHRFFRIVWISLAVLLLTGMYLLVPAGRQAPGGWFAMLAIGLVMAVVFVHLHAGPYRRLRLAVQAQAWPDAAREAAGLPRLVWLNFVLGWVAIAAVRGWT